MLRLRQNRACSIALTLITNFFVALPALAVVGWNAVGPAALGRDTIALAASSSRFVALNDAQGLLYSDDGFTWLRPTSVPPVHHLTALAHGNGTFVAVGNGALSSIDGQTWTFTRIAQSRFTSIGFNGARFIAAGATGPTLMTSTDGSTWSAVSNAPASFGTTANIAVGNGITLAYGSGTTMMRSADGVTWQSVVAPVAGGRAFWDGTQFVFAANATGPWFGSADGSAWASLGAYNVEVPLATATLGAATFYLYDDRVDHGRGAANPGGGVTAAGPEVLRAIAATSSAVIAGGEVGAWYRYADAAGWSTLGGVNAVNGDEGALASVELGGSVLAWTAGPGTISGSLVNLGQKQFRPGHVMKSANGTSWTAPVVAAPPAPGADLGEMVVFGGLVYTVSADRLYSSSNGETWTQVHQFPWPLATIATDGTTLVVSGASATEMGIASSTNATAWTTFLFPNALATSFLPVQIVKTVHGWIGYPSGVGYWISSDAANWTHFSPVGISNVGSVSADNGRIYYVQRNGGLTRWTENNIDWTIAPFHLRFLEAPRWDGTRWYGVARQLSAQSPEHLPAVYESVDGQDWNIVRDSEFFDPRHIHVGAEGTFAFGAGGRVLQLSSYPALVGQVTQEVNLVPAITDTRSDSLATLSGVGAGVTYRLIYDGAALGTVTVDPTSGAFSIANPDGLIGAGSFDYYVDYGGRQSNRGRVAYTLTVDTTPPPSGGGGGAIDGALALVLAALAARRARRRAPA